MTDYVTLLWWAADDKQGPPNYKADLADDSNSTNGIPDDWTDTPQLNVSKKGGALIVRANTAVEIVICQKTDDPSIVNSIPLRPPVGGDVTLKHNTDYRDCIFVRRTV